MMHGLQIQCVMHGMDHGLQAIVIWFIPGGNSCIRFEKLREGIVDYEKIRILREEASKSNDKDVQNLMQQLDDHLKVFLAEKDFETKKITADVDKGKKIVEEVSDKLGRK